MTSKTWVWHWGQPIAASDLTCLFAPINCEQQHPILELLWKLKKVMIRQHLAQYLKLYQHPVSIAIPVTTTHLPYLSSVPVSLFRKEWADDRDHFKIWNISVLFKQFPLGSYRLKQKLFCGLWSWMRCITKLLRNIGIKTIVVSLMQIHKIYRCINVHMCLYIYTYKFSHFIDLG